MLHRRNHSPTTSEDIARQLPQGGERRRLPRVREKRPNLRSNITASGRRTGRYPLPRNVSVRQLGGLQAHFQMRGHGERDVRMMDSEVHHSIAEWVERLLPLIRDRRHFDLRTAHRLGRSVTRQQPCDRETIRHRCAVEVFGAMNHSEHAHAQNPPIKVGFTGSANQCWPIAAESASNGPRTAST